MSVCSIFIFCFVICLVYSYSFLLFIFYRVCVFMFVFVFFFKQKTAYEMRISDWSSDVCSSDLDLQVIQRIQNLSGEWQAICLPTSRCPTISTLCWPNRRRSLPARRARWHWRRSTCSCPKLLAVRPT